MGRGTGSILNEDDQIIVQGLGRGESFVITENNQQTGQDLLKTNGDVINNLQNENATETIDDNENESFTITQMINMSKENNFPKKPVWFGLKKNYTHQFFIFSNMNLILK